MTDYAALVEVVARRTPGEWLVRPDIDDQWGFIRSTWDKGLVADTGMYSRMTDDEQNEARRTGTVPPQVEANALAICTAVNHFAGAAERVEELERRLGESRMNNAKWAAANGNLQTDIARIEAENAELNERRKSALAKYGEALAENDRLTQCFEREATIANNNIQCLEAENTRLRKILAHVPGRIAIEAKEAAGFGVEVRAALSEPEKGVEK